MNAAVASAGTLAWALLFVTGCAGSIFEVDYFHPTFANLSSRQCLLPGDFNTSSIHPVADRCAEIVSGPELPVQCQDAPLLANFYNCHSNGRELIGVGPAPPNGERLEAAIAGIYDNIKIAQSLLSTDPAWISVAYQSLDACAAGAVDGLSPNQAAVYAFLCLKWTYFSKCDVQLEMEKRVDAIAARRGVDFFYGGCPLSPGRLETLEAISRIFGGKRVECFAEPFVGTDDIGAYKDIVAKGICMLEDFQKGNKLDYAKLQKAIVADITVAHSKGAELLLSVINTCEMGDNERTEDFVKCWKNLGLFSCVYQQANAVAAAFPNNCKISP